MGWVLRVSGSGRALCVAAALANELAEAADDRLVLAVAVTWWLCLEVHTTPQRIACHTHDRGKDARARVMAIAVATMTTAGPTVRPGQDC